MMPPLRTLTIANSAILSYNPRNLLEKRFQTRNRITYHDLQKKKIFLATKTPFWESFLAAFLLVGVGPGFPPLSATVRRGGIPGTPPQTKRQLSQRRHKRP